MTIILRIVAALTVTLMLTACGSGNGGNTSTTPPSPAPDPASGGADPMGDATNDHDHGDEVDLGTTMVGEHEVSCAQGHGDMAAGVLSHLVVKLPYNDGGDTVVRAWIGTSDRDRWEVGKGDYAASHDDYDIHATAPDPLPDGAQWWIEVTKPDGTVLTGSIDYK